VKSVYIDYSGSCSDFPIDEVGVWGESGLALDAAIADLRLIGSRELVDLQICGGDSTLSRDSTG
jgi:hypothetical protein